MRSTLLSSTLLILLGTTLMGAEKGEYIRDVRFFLGAVPPSDNVDIAYDFTNASHDSVQGGESIAGLDWGYRFGIETTFSLGKTTGWGAPIVMLGLFSAQQGGDPGPATRAFPGPVSLGAMGGSVGLGWAVRVSKKWTIEALGLFSYAGTTVTDELYNVGSTTATSEISGTGYYREVGARLAGTFTPNTTGFQVSLGAGWQSMHASGRITDPPYTYLKGKEATGHADYTFSGAGFYPYAEIGYRF